MCVECCLVGDGAALSEAGVSASGVVAVEPAERVEAGLVFAGPGLAALERLAFERRVEGLGERVVRRTANSRCTATCLIVASGRDWYSATASALNCGG